MNRGNASLALYNYLVSVTVLIFLCVNTAIHLL